MGRYFGCLILAVVGGLFVCLAALNCDDVDGDDPDRQDDTTPADTGHTVEDTPDRTWGLWYGALPSAGWWFEQVPTAATMTPRLAIFQNGTAAIISTRLVPPDESDNEIAQQALHLAYRLPWDEWVDNGELLRSSPAYGFTSIVAAKDGLLHVLYGHNGHALHLLLGINFMNARVVDDGSSPVLHGAIAEDPNGHIHAVYGGYGLFHEVYFLDWWTEIAKFEKGDYPDLVFDADGIGHLVFLISRGLDAGYRLMHYSYDSIAGTAWFGGEVLPDIAFQPQPHVAVDSKGNVRILAPSEIGLLYISCPVDNDSSCEYEIAAGSDWSAGFQYADLELPNDEPLAVYRDANTADGFVGHRTNLTWTWERLRSFDTGFIGMDLALDTTGTPELVFAGWKLGEKQE